MVTSTHLTATFTSQVSSMPQSLMHGFAPHMPALLPA